MDILGYLSQIVGGAGLGVVHALATNKIVESKLAQKLDVGFDFDNQGNPAIKVGFNF